MILTSLSLSNFRNYKKREFAFSPNTTIIVGPNTAGKTNLIESVYLLSLAKAFRSADENVLILLGEEMSRVKGSIQDKEETIELEVVLTVGEVTGIKTPYKKYLVNGVSKRRIDFTGKLPVVLFVPSDLDLLTGSPGTRRNFLDDVLEQVSVEYRTNLLNYTKGIRQRNALLEQMREVGRRQEKQLSYWNEVVITHGQKITAKREEFITYLNTSSHDVFPFTITYDSSTISEERLEKYANAELGAAVTLVGPHRDDMVIHMGDTSREVKLYGSRGQQRLTVLQLKLLQLSFMEQALGNRPLLLMDDIFSELDNTHIDLVYSIIDKQQTILTTTHAEFVPEKVREKCEVIELVIKR